MLSKYAEQLRSQAPTLGLVDADTTLKLNKPELRVEIDRARAADLGVETEDIARALRLMVGGEEKVSRFHNSSVNEDYDVQLRLRDGDRNDPDTIWRLYVPRQGGGLVRLDNLVKLVPGRKSVAYRPHGQRAHGQLTFGDCARLCAGRPYRSVAGRHRSHGYAGRL